MDQTYARHSASKSFSAASKSLKLKSTCFSKEMFKLLDAAAASIISSARSHKYTEKPAALSVLGKPRTLGHTFMILHFYTISRPPLRELPCVVSARVDFRDVGDQLFQ